MKIAPALDRRRRTRAISERAYELFRGGSTCGALADWLSAERELIAKPAAELTENHGRFEVLSALPGFDAKDVDVQITADDVLIEAESSRERATEKGKIHLSEFGSAAMFWSIHFPQPIDPATAKAYYKNGMLHVSADIAKEKLDRKIDIKAA